MRPVELTPRLMNLATQVPQGSRFVDVGTDHARLPVWLLEHDIIDQAIATDLRQGPLDRAKRTASRHQMTGRISFRLSDGLADVKEQEVDVVAIAGMGGETIATILEHAPWTTTGQHLFLLQPMTSTPDLRRWLTKNGFSIHQESLVQEGETLYNTMTVGAGDSVPYTEGEIWAGRQWEGMDAPHRTHFLEVLIERAHRAERGLSQSSHPDCQDRMKRWNSLQSELTEMKEMWESWQK